MGRFDTTKATINANIKKNGNQEITGSILNSVMTEMVDATDAELATLSEEIDNQRLEILGNTKIDIPSSEQGWHYYSIPSLKKGVEYTFILETVSPITVAPLYWHFDNGDTEIFGALVVSNGGATSTKKYTATDDFQDLKLAMYSGAAIPSCVLTYEIENSVINEIEQSISMVAEQLSEEIGELESYSKETKDIRASLTLNINGFVKATGGIGDDAISLNANYRVWNPIEMKEGDIISINAYIPSSVAFISEYNRDTMQYTPLVVGTGETKEWTYTAISDMVVVMSTPYIPASTTVNYTTSVLLKTQVSRNKADIEQLKDKSISSALFNEIKQCVLNVAYSAVEGFNINTEEQFMSAKKMGFNSQKADIALTSDNSLVMCHDKGLTFDAYGRSVDYSSSNNMPILSMTREEFCSVEYATKTGVNYYSKHTDFESFLKCCKATGVIPYITLRDSTYYNADIVIPKMVEALNKYNLKDRCIISSYPHSIENLTKVRNALPNCLLAYVCNYEEVIDNTLINSLRTLGNSIIMLASSKQGSDLYSFISSQNEQITNAKDNGLIIGMCDITDVDIYNNLVSMGLSAFQIYKPIFSGIRESFDFFLEVRQTSNNYTIKIADNTYIMLRSMLGARPIFSPIAELSEDGKVLTLSQFKKFKSDSSFPDGILEQWITRLPFVLGKSEGTSLQQVTLSRIDGKMTLKFSDSIKEYIEPSTFEIHFEI